MLRLTTILGIKTNSEKENAVVLAADTQINIYQRGKAVETDKESKIWEGNNWLAAITGAFDDRAKIFMQYLRGEIVYSDFRNVMFPERNNKGGRPMMLPTETLLMYCAKKATRDRVADIAKGNTTNMTELEQVLGRFMDGEVKPSTDVGKFLLRIVRQLGQQRDPVREAIYFKYFFELHELNRARMRSAGPDDYLDGDIQLNDMVIGTNYDGNIGLYAVDEQGNMLQQPSDQSGLEYFCKGSGQTLVYDYLNEKEFMDDPLVAENINLEKIDIQSALMLARAMVKKAMKDIGTGGVVELAVLTSNQIRKYGDKIQRAIDDAEDEAFRDIMEEYLPEGDGQEEPD